MTATFSVSLREQPVWHDLGPALASSTIWKFKESAITTHTLTLPLPLPPPSKETHDAPNVVPSSSLHILLFISSDLTSSSLPTTKSRLSTFTTSLSGVPRHYKLVVLIQTTSPSLNNGKIAGTGEPNVTIHEPPPQGLQAYLILQNLLFQLPSPHVPPPLLPTSSPSTLLATLHTYLISLTTPHPIPPPHSSPHLLLRSHALLSHITTSLPNTLPPHATNILSDLFPNFQALEPACRTAEGRRLLSEYLGEFAGRVVGFWERDWAVD